MRACVCARAYLVLVQSERAIQSVTRIHSLRSTAGTAIISLDEEGVEGIEEYELPGVEDEDDPDEPSDVDGDGGGALNGEANPGRVGTEPPAPPPSHA